MKTAMSDGTRRLLAALLLLVLVLSLASAAVCLARHVHHGCAGADCPLCACVRRVGELLRALALCAAAASLPAASAAGVRLTGGACAARLEPAARGVRMND